MIDKQRLVPRVLNAQVETQGRQKLYHIPEVLRPRYQRATTVQGDDSHPVSLQTRQDGLG